MNKETDPFIRHIYHILLTWHTCCMMSQGLWKNWDRQLNSSWEFEVYRGFFSWGIFFLS